MIIPTKREVLIDLGLHAKAGLLVRGVTVGVAQNTAERVTTDLENLVGEADSLTKIGAQGQYNKLHGELTEARAARNAAHARARSLCLKAVDSLKSHLGRRWNPRWTAAGFGGFTLTVTDGVLAAKLLELRNFYRDNPVREVASEGLTAAAFNAEFAAFQAAEQGRDAALSTFRDARDARDAATAQLKKRLSGLQEELRKLMGPSDNRWADFGFPRPIDGSMPAAVEELTATPGLPGQALVQHDASARALDYRVSWQLQDGSGDRVVVGLFADLAVTLSGLPSGATIVVSVTARNAAGETSPTSVTIVVP